MSGVHQTVVSGYNQNFMCLVRWVQRHNNEVCLCNNCYAIARSMDAKCIESGDLCFGTLFYCTRERKRGDGFFFFF